MDEPYRARYPFYPEREWDNESQFFTHRAIRQGEGDVAYSLDPDAEPETEWRAIPLPAFLTMKPELREYADFLREWGAV